MHMLGRLFAMFCIFAITAIAWLSFGAVMTSRTHQQQAAMEGRVNDLWGRPQEQKAPTLDFRWFENVSRIENVVNDQGVVQRDKQGNVVQHKVEVPEARNAAVNLESSRLAVGIRLDERRKGLMWFSLYDVDFAGSWVYRHDRKEKGWLAIDFRFPDPSGSYDNFRIVVNDEELQDLTAKDGLVEALVPVSMGDEVRFDIGYTTRGLDQWSYRPTDGVGQIENFELAMSTDFSNIDFPPYTLSPSSKEQAGDGWKLRWDFSRMVSGNGIGMTMPQKIQPGPLASEMSTSAPLSLLLFMAWVFVLGLLRKVDIHPMNHLFLAAAFFSFHLLFGYLADQVVVEVAFAAASVTSVVLAVSYLRLVAGSRFAFVEAGLAQLLYLVGFSLAHFWKGSTGLTLTILGIVTLFALMQLTGRIKWSTVFSSQGEEKGEGGR